jgi:aspartyl-tRNA(Asn)/glutamyl-tRNA(Gln) amidotransferase subunit C
MLSTEEVKHIALLARIGLSDEEVESYRKDLSSVLDFFHELEALDLPEEGKQTASVPVKENDTRTDRAEDFGTNGKKRIMDGVPVKQDGFVKVRSVF